MADAFNLQNHSSVSSKKKRARSVDPMSLRNPFVPQYLGGSFGYRGGDWRAARAQALKKADYKSEITGFPNEQDQLQVDHIYPYRIGGSNKLENLRVTNFQDNYAVDNIKNFDIKEDVKTRKF